MMEIIGWLTVALGGAYVAFLVGIRVSDLFMPRAGLEGIPALMAAGVVSAVVWIVAVFMMAPFTIVVTP